MMSGKIYYCQPVLKIGRTPKSFFGKPAQLGMAPRLAPVPYLDDGNAKTSS